MNDISLGMSCNGHFVLMIFDDASHVKDKNNFMIFEF